MELIPLPVPSAGSVLKHGLLGLEMQETQAEFARPQHPQVPVYPCDNRCPEVLML